MALLKFTRKEGEGYRLEPQERSNGRVGGGGADAGGGSAAASASRTYDESIEAIQHELARYAHGDDTVDDEEHFQFADVSGLAGFFVRFFFFSRHLRPISFDSGRFRFWTFIAFQMDVVRMYDGTFILSSAKPSFA